MSLGQNSLSIEAARGESSGMSIEFGNTPNGASRRRGAVNLIKGGGVVAAMRFP